MALLMLCSASKMGCFFSLFLFLSDLTRSFIFKIIIVELKIMTKLEQLPSILILMEQGEEILQSIFGVGFPYSWADDIEEFRKLDRFALFSKSLDER